MNKKFWENFCTLCLIYVCVVCFTVCCDFLMNCSVSSFFVYIPDGVSIKLNPFIYVIASLFIIRNTVEYVKLNWINA